MTPSAVRFACPLLFALAAACSTKKGEPAPNKDPWASSATPAAKTEEPAKDAKDAKAAPPEVPAGQMWRRRSEKTEWTCGQLKMPEESYEEPEALYKSALKLGRKEAAARRWGDAAVAFEYANKQRAAKDPAALSELSWAQLQSGEPDFALDAARRASEEAVDPKQKAGALYNAGRAAESLGQLEEARGFYEGSVKLRDTPAITERIAKLAAPVRRSAEEAPLMKECQDQPSLEAACECLGKTAAAWGGAHGLGAKATCEVEKSQGERGGLVSVSSGPAVPEALAPGRALVFVAKQGKGWSALRVVESSRDVDLAETPRATHVAEVTRYDELPYRGGALVWIETQQQQQEWAIGENDVQGSRGLTICALPEGKAASCTQWVLGEWSYLHTPSQREGEDACQSRELALYFVMMDATGKVNVMLASGVDKKGLTGEYAL